MFIVACQVDVFNLKRKGLADAEIEFRNQAEQQPVAATMGGDGRQDGGDLPRAQTTWCGWIETDAVELPHRVSGMSSRRYAQARKLASAASLRAAMRAPDAQSSRRSCAGFPGDGRGGTAVEAEQAAEVRGTGQFLAALLHSVARRSPAPAERMDQR
jgi:hypothetical protein